MCVSGVGSRNSAVTTEDESATMPDRLIVWHRPAPGELSRRAHKFVSERNSSSSYPAFADTVKVRPASRQLSSRFQG